MKTLAKLRGKVSSFVGSPFQSSLSSGASKAALFLLVFMACSVFAQTTDYTTMTAGLNTEISGAKTVLMTIATAVLGVSVLFVIYRFFKRILG